MERRTRIQPGTAQNWRSEPHTSQSLLFPSCLCLCLIICTDMRSLFFPYYSIYVRSSISYQFIFQRVFYELIAMLLEVWNPEIGILFSIQQRKVLTQKTLWNQHRSWKKIPLSGASTFPVLPSSRCLRAAVLSPPWGQPLRDSHGPDDICQERLKPLVWYGLIESKP